MSHFSRPRAEFINDEATHWAAICRNQKDRPPGTFTSWELACQQVGVTAPTRNSEAWKQVNRVDKKIVYTLHSRGHVECFEEGSTNWLKAAAARHRQMRPES